MDIIVEWGTVIGAFVTFLAVLVALFMPLFERFKTQKFEKKVIINKMNLTSLEELYNLFTVRAEKVITLIEEYGSIRGGLEHNSIILKLNESNSKKTKKITDEGISIKLQKEELISKKIMTARQIGIDNLYFISKLNFIQAQLKIDFKDDFQKKLNKLEGYFKEDQLTKQKEQNLFNLINEVIDDFYHYQNNVILRKRDEILNELN